MKATELLKKLRNKLLGKKDTSATDEHVAGDTIALESPEATVSDIPILDGLGVIELHENWRN